MSVELRLPDLGEGIEEADVLTVLVDVGQAVAAGDSVIEIESEKATLEVPADGAGTVKSVHVKAGDTITVGQPLLTLDAAAVAAEPSPTIAVAPATSTTDGNQPSDEALTEDVAPPPALEAAATAGTDGQAPVVEVDADGRPVPAAPSVRTFAREIGVDVRHVPGSGPTGRISIGDVKAHARTRGALGTAEPEAPLPDFAQWGHVERTRMSRLRRTIAQKLAHSWATVPHVTLFSEADVTDVEAVRKQYRASAEARGAKLTITALLLPVVAAALKANPKLNTSLDLRAGELVRKHYYHLGVAADTERGLLVPVIRDVDQKGAIDLAVEMMGLAESARSGKLAPEEMQGATFTISNLGGLGTGFFTPIVNPPEVGILGVGRAVARPTLFNDVVQTRLIMPLSLSFDHRALDGADGARFLSWIVDALERPMILTMER